jgi:exonuclease VII small subunit
MNIAASNNPFGENIDLRQKAEDYLKQAEQRIQVQIYQKFRIDFFSQLIKELE